MPYLPYIYLLRVPLLCSLLLVLFAPLALLPDAPGSPLLHGMFDVRQGDVFVVSLIVFFAVATFTVSTDLVLRYGFMRFGVPQFPPHLMETNFHFAGLDISRITFRFCIFYLICGASLIAGLLFDARATAALKTIAVVFAAVVFTLVIWIAGVIWRHSSPASTEWIADLLRFTPEGYTTVNVAEAPLLPGHGFALILLLLSLAFYATLGISKALVIAGAGLQRWWKIGALPAVPTLGCVLLLLLLYCWLFSGLAFLLDRFRIPILLPLALILAVAAQFPQSDHYFHAQENVKSTPLYPAEALAGAPADSAIVVCASGGGIQAAAWAAKVLEKLTAGNPAFAESVRLISSVSGGSAGALFFADAYRGGRVDPTKLREQVFLPASASTLDDVAWGLGFPDLIRAFFPYVIPRHVDRGWALEHSWARFGTVATARLSQWRKDSRLGRRPGVIFNTTLVESGERCAIASVDFKNKPPGAQSFRELYPDTDIGAATAARLSAAFPYVSPAARSDATVPKGKRFHFVDGGYYDNFGVSSAAEWLNEAMAVQGPIRKVLVVQIQGPLATREHQSKGSRGWFYQAFAPAATVLHVRDTGQQSHNETELNLLTDAGRGRGVIIQRALFPYPNYNTPLSWHLTENEIQAIDDSWNTFEQCPTDDDPKCSGLRKVRKFLADVKPAAGK